MQKKHLTIEQAHDFVQNHSFALPANEITGSSFRCIDDRNNEPKDTIPPVAIPGSTLDVYINTLAALGALSDHLGRVVSYDRHVVFTIVEGMVGKISFHTDNTKEHSVICGGCGHVYGSLTKADKYLLSVDDVSYVTSALLPHLESKGYTPVVYEGSHDANAVFIIDDAQTALPNQGDGVQAYVYNRAHHKKLVTDALDLAVAHYASQFGNIDPDLNAEIAWNVAENRTGVSVTHLAAELPKFLVQNGTVTQVGEPAMVLAE